MSAVADQLAPPGGTPAEREARGRELRSEVPRRSHAAWEVPAGRADPVAVLAGQAEPRVPELVPLRHGRMLASPFAFFRGAAAIMAADLAGTPATGVTVQACGDAHLSNFGIFAAPDRRLVFDINDFDETAPGPWEWDVKRLVASFAVAGRDLGFSEAERREAELAAAERYRLAMRGFAAMGTLDVWYARFDVEGLPALASKRVRRERGGAFRRELEKARGKTSMRAFEKLTHEVDGEPRIVADPPLVVPIADLLPPDEGRDLTEAVRGLLGEYRASLPADRARLFDGYRFVDLARKVVGVGSVGTRAWIVLLAGRDASDPLFLQVKEAEASVLEPHVGDAGFANRGQRVVEGQRLMQAASDIMLGWLHNTTGLDGRGRDFYVRQLWDAKRSAEIERMDAGGLALYAGLCGWTLARAHARTGDRIAIAAYLGGGDRFDRALADFAEAYAEQNERDHARLAAAVEAGELEATTGL